MSGFPSDGPALALALRDTRARTLALMQAWCEALPGLRVPQEPTLNLPLWEWGHVGWFQTWWVGRNRQRALGRRCDPHHPRLPPAWDGADACFNSSTVAHERRWGLDLPSLTQTRAELARGLAETLRLLEEAGRRGEDLYCWQLVLVHEDMHNEASLYMAQALGLPMPAAWVHGHGREGVEEAAAGRPGFVNPGVPGVGGAADDAGRPRGPIRVQAQRVTIGHDPADRCFGFDNEYGAHEVSLPAFEIDARPVNWAEYLAFVQETGRSVPRAIRREGHAWQFRHFGEWQALDLQAPAAYLTAADAQAWCAWAGRFLPTEAQWEAAARTATGFDWGRVWEWTASPFEPYPGFEPHPYRDYSEPWFGTHRVLRGASAFTAARLCSPSYRNFFLPGRCDIPAGFRTVSGA